MKKKIFLLGGLALLVLLCVFQCEYLDSSLSLLKPTPKQTGTSPVLKHHADSMQKVFAQQSIVLEKQNDSLLTLVQFQQKNLSAYKLKAKILEQDLKSRVKNADVLKNDTLLIPLMDEYTAVNALKDSACDETIADLQKVVENQQEELSLCKETKTSLHLLSADQETSLLNLTEQLNAASKQQHRLRVKNRFLAAGLAVAAGFAGSVLIKQRRP